MYFCPVKRRILQICSLLMALQVLLVTHGLSVNFHLCTEDHHLMSSFGDASLLCEHCLGHHHHEHMDEQEFEAHLQVLHFGSKCCCEDYDSEIGFTEEYTFSSEKSLMISLASFPLTDWFQMKLDECPTPNIPCFIHEKIPYLLTGRLRTIFFSHLKLNPLV